MLLIKPIISYDVGDPVEQSTLNNARCPGHQGSKPLKSTYDV